MNPNNYDLTTPNNYNRKIIHIDMDCFYAAVEIRDNPQLIDLPVAVGGSADRRGVLCTCNYVARKFGLHSAMATAYALKRCPELRVIAPNFAKYKEVSRQIQQIFRRYTDLVEPLALDEAYLDVSNSPHEQGSATRIAEKIRAQIYSELNLTCSAGVSSNKFLAKIASGWNKPNGILVIQPQQIAEFICQLPVNKLFGVGKVTAARLQKMKIINCSDLQKFTLPELTQHFGKFGTMLYYQARGIDNRQVNPNRPRKSLSVERTFAKNITVDEIDNILINLYQEFNRRLQESKITHPIHSLFCKVKFADFRQTTREQIGSDICIANFRQLFTHALLKTSNPEIRLLGIGVSFDLSENFSISQPELF